MSKVIARAARLKTNTIVMVNGTLWQLVSSLADSGPRDRDFTARRTAGGKTVIKFGDDVHGARPPAGSEITVRYNSGGGVSGNTVTVTIERNVSNPTSDLTVWVVIRNRTSAIRRTASRKKQ